NFGHLLRKQLRHELRVSAGKENLWSTRFLPDVVDKSTDPLALTEAFTGQQLVAAQHCLGTPEIDDDVAELDPLNQPVDDLADTVLEQIGRASCRERV